MMCLGWKMVAYTEHEELRCIVFIRGSRHGRLAAKSEMARLAPTAEPNCYFLIKLQLGESNITWNFYHEYGHNQIVISTLHR